jgi:hypothetical protein
MKLKLHTLVYLLTATVLFGDYPKELTPDYPVSEQALKVLAGNTIEIANSMVLNKEELELLDLIAKFNGAPPLKADSRDRVGSDSQGGATH